MINRNFRRLWAGDLISQFGDRVTEPALPLIAVATPAATPAQVGLLTATVWTPNLLGVLAGAWVDRQPHQPLGVVRGRAGPSSPRRSRCCSPAARSACRPAGLPAGRPAGVLGLAFGLGAVGGLAGAVLAPRLAKRYGVGAAGLMIFDINLNAVQTAVTADHMRSRMAGVFSTINYGSRPLGAAIGGVLGSWIGIRPTLLLAAVGGAMCNL